MRKMKRGKGLIAVLAAVLVFGSFLGAALPLQTVCASEEDALETTAAGGEITTVRYTVHFGQGRARAMLGLVNDFRTGSDAWYWNESNTAKIKKTDLRELYYDKELEAIAMQRAAEVAIYFSHTRPNGENCFSLTSNGISSSGENIAAGLSDEAGIFYLWQENAQYYAGQGHRRNMLNENFTSIGIGHVEYEGVHFWVQEFGTEGAGTDIPMEVNASQKVSVDIATSIAGQASGIWQSSNVRALQGSGSTWTLPLISCNGLTMSNESFSRLGSFEIVPGWQAADDGLLAIDGNKMTALQDSGSTEVYAYVFGNKMTCRVDVGCATATPETMVGASEAQTRVLAGQSIQNIAGASRAETSIMLADQLKKVLGVEKFQTVILASGTDYPDGLGASTLSTLLNAPVLIVRPAEEALIRKYVGDNLISGGNIIICGGTGAVSQNMENSAKEFGEIIRLGGINRYATNERTIREALLNGADKEELLIVSGENFADALSASATGKVLMIVGAHLTEGQKSILRDGKFAKLTILGGNGAVSDVVKTEIEQASGKAVERIGGKTRIETSQLIAKRYCPNSNVRVYTKADGFADGIAGGLLANRIGAPMCLVYGAKDMTQDGKSIRLGGVK